MDEIKREEVTETSNTAQQEFTYLLNQMHKQTPELIFENAIHGDLDFSELKDQGFDHIEKIVFLKPGEVTHIRNLPVGLKILDCKYQLLNTIESIPTTIEELYLTGNYFSKLDLHSYSKLRILHISENELESLTGIPESIQEIECEENQLTKLDLKNATQLHTLKCSNNPILVIENLPSSVTTLEMDNSNYTEIDDAKNKEKTKKQPRVDYLTSLYEYFRIKNEYESKLHKMKQNAFHRAVNKKQGMQKARTLIPPCIQCKRKVGTLFSRKDGKYIAICGDKSHPCPLNIQIYSGYFFNNESLMNIYKEDMDRSKETIIAQKMDTLFSYVSEKESVKKFKAELDEYTKTSKSYSDILQKYDDLHNNLETELVLKKNTAEMYRLISEIKNSIQDYEKTRNRESLAYAVNLYTKELMPVIQFIRMKKYAIMETDISAEDQTTLVQYKIPLHKMDFTFGEEPSVIKFSFGS
jgi:hypothetical protein